MSTSFFNKKKAEKFAKYVNGKVWMDTDGFGQIIYIVKWH